VTRIGADIEANEVSEVSDEITVPLPCRNCKRKIRSHKQAIYLWMTPDGPLYTCSRKCYDEFTEDNVPTDRCECAAHNPKIRTQEEDMAAKKKKAVAAKAAPAPTKAVPKAKVTPEAKKQREEIKREAQGGVATPSDKPVPKVTQATTVAGTVMVTPKSVPTTLPADAPQSLKALPYYSAVEGIDAKDFAAKLGRIVAIRESMEAMGVEEKALREDLMVALMTADVPVVAAGYHTVRVVEGKTQPGRLSTEKLIAAGVTAEQINTARGKDVEIDPYAEIRDARKKDAREA
jgi:hypothetical protein